MNVLDEMIKRYSQLRLTAVNRVLASSPLYYPHRTWTVKNKINILDFR